MISSILDNDLYKFVMQSAVASKFPHAIAEYTFINRNETPFPYNFHVALQDEVAKMSKLSLTKDECDFLESSFSWLKPTYLDLLRGYRFDPDDVSIDMSSDKLIVNIDGPWYRTILWEVPLMAMISELYFKKTNQPVVAGWMDRAATKGEYLTSTNYADFGTRRRYSQVVHDRVVQILSGYPGFVGTSNVGLAKKYNVKAIGTQAHEWIQGHAAIYGYRMANQMAMNSWVDEFQGEMGIALTDTFTTNDFFRVFDKKYAKLFDGVRHDSGDPIVFANKTINHYKNLGIDPLSKTIVFSDGLNVENVLRIFSYCKGKIKVSFGIGTHFTNDVGVKPLNIVIKLTALSHDKVSSLVPCIKLSDVEGKHTGNIKEIGLCKNILNLD